MKVTERVKIFTGADTKKLEKMYAKWFDTILEERLKIPVLRGYPPRVIERSLVIRNYEGDETFALAVFYEDYILENHEVGEDRGGHLKGGVSMNPPPRRKR
jgi:hypothetical protein